MVFALSLVVFALLPAIIGIAFYIDVPRLKDVGGFMFFTGMTGWLTTGPITAIGLSYCFDLPEPMLMIGFYAGWVAPSWAGLLFSLPTAMKARKE